jgi:hypothetical protein
LGWFVVDFGSVGDGWVLGIGNFGLWPNWGLDLLWPIECFVVDFLGVVSVVNDCGLRIFLFWWALGKPV